MGIIKKLADQCRKPSGFTGRLIGRLMNVEHNSVRKWGLGKISIETDSVILDIGCGGGKTIKVMSGASPGGRVYGIDYSPDMTWLSRKLNINNNRAAIIQGSVSSLPFSDNSLDIVTAFETCFFWPDLTGDLKEINRTLKPSGSLLLVSTAYKDEDRSTKKNEWAEISGTELHTIEEWRRFLIESGYCDIMIHTKPEKNWISATARKTSTVSQAGK